MDSDVSRVIGQSRNRDEMVDLISPDTEELFLRVPEAYPELQG
jgi:hypothetical protein